MSKRDERALSSVARGLVAGVVAGAVASFAMDRFQAAVSPLLPSGGGGSEPATEKAADEVARFVTGNAVPVSDKPLAGQAVHYGLGIGLGVVYGVLAEFRPAVTSGFGTAFGVATATFLDEGLVPAVGLGRAPWKSDAATNLYSYVSHLVFGATAELVRRQVARSLTS